MSNEALRLHMARCIAIQRRGTQQRLQFAIARWDRMGLDQLFDSEKAMLATAQAELKKVETAMRRAGQSP